MVDISQGVIVGGCTHVLPQFESFAGVKSVRSGFEFAGDAPRMTGPVRLRPVVAPSGGSVVRFPGSVPGGLTV